MEIKFKQFQFKWKGQETPLLDIPSWTIEPGSRLLIRGPSGSGKTTLLHCMAGLLEPTQGSITVEGRSYRTLGENERCRGRWENIGLIFQRLNLLKHLTALENVMLGCNEPNRSRRSTALEALEMVELSSLAGRLACFLSMGEQQRTAVARVLAGSRRLILADEPTSSLDQQNTVKIIDALLRAADTHSSTLVVVSHDERVENRFEQVLDITRIGKP